MSTPDITTLAHEIADDAAMLTIERYAERAEGHPRGMWNVDVVDLAEIEEGDILDIIVADLKRAVVYLDARGRLLRPVQGQEHLVKIAGVA